MVRKERYTMMIDGQAENNPKNKAECRRCPLYKSQECLIAPSRILLFFFCPLSEGFRPPEGWPGVQAEALLS
jgi:hypothetical protein